MSYQLCLSLDLLWPDECVHHCSNKLVLGDFVYF